jgi:hypothetical protein
MKPIEHQDFYKEYEKTGAVAWYNSNETPNGKQYTEGYVYWLELNLSSATYAISKIKDPERLTNCLTHVKDLLLAALTNQNHIDTDSQLELAIGLIEEILN